MLHRSAPADIAEHDLDPALRAAAEQRLGCARGTLTATEYEGLLAATGFAAITPAGDAGAGLHSAIVQAGEPR